MKRRQQTAQEKLRDLEDEYRRARMSGENTAVLECDIEQVRAAVLAEAVVQRADKTT